MAENVLKQVSPRHQFPFDQIPTMKASMYGGSISTATPAQYGPMLDSLYEMTRDVGDANGVPYKDAMETVIKDEGWRFLPKHKAMILNHLEKHHGNKT